MSRSVIATAKAAMPHGLAAVNALYGNPRGTAGRVNPEWYAASITMMPLPYPMRLAWDTDNEVRRIAVHRLCVPDLTAILQDIYNHCRLEAKQRFGYEHDTAFYDVKTLGILGFYGLDLYGGAFNYRLKRGGSSLSLHSWGIAIDIDPERNGMGDTTPNMPAFAVNAFERRGWYWGGHWTGRGCDGMHFQRATGI